MPVAESHDPIAKAVFYALMAGWMLFALTFLLRKREPGSAVTKRNPVAFAGIGLQMVGYALVWFRPWLRPRFSPIVALPRWVEIVLAAATLAIVVVSVWIVNAAARRLGKQWAIAARLVEGHKLITDGPYRLVRNPIYAGMFGMMIATGLAVTRWQVLLAAIVVFAAGTWIRVRSEEQLLRGAFGDAFEEYARNVPAVIPWIW